MGATSCVGVGCPGLGALPAPAARPWGVRPGPATSLAEGLGDVGVGTRHLPHRARSCLLGLRAVGAARGSPRGAPLAWVSGVRG